MSNLSTEFNSWQAVQVIGRIPNVLTKRLPEVSYIKDVAP